ncbi:MAG: hypothetical protein HQL64_10345 [Magnetococcales bacterium]|nr:hypothetical protein [Magnetococcales bacterium]
MYTIYRLNADELTVDFLESLKTLFRHKSIEISICETAAQEQDETAYLLAHPANRSRLLSAIENVQHPEGQITVDHSHLE